MGQNLWFLFVEHRRLLVEGGKNLFKLRIATLDDDSHILLPSLFSSEFYRSRHIVLLLLCTVEPTQEETGTLSLFTSFGAAHIKQDIRVLTEKL